MPRYIALLRGINVGGHRIIKMDALREMFAAAGARDVATYIQSGNVVFRHPRATAARFEAYLESEVGFAVPVVLRTAAEWARLIDANPFAGVAEDHLHVMLLADAPARDALANVSAVAPERFVARGRDVYVCLPGGIGRSKLAGSLMKALPAATARNWRTVRQLHAMAAQ